MRSRRVVASLIVVFLITGAIGGYFFLQSQRLYQFVVDDDWINDPDNPVLANSGNGGLASLIEKR